MKTTHNEIEITYNEDKDRWDFELRGRQRSAESLAKAKEAIDKEPVEKRKQVFPRFAAYLKKNWEGYVTVTVTSMADAGYRGGIYFWIAMKDGTRQKEGAESLFPVNEKNTSIIAEIARLDAMVAALKEKISAQQGKLQSATVPKELA